MEVFNFLTNLQEKGTGIYVFTLVTFTAILAGLLFTLIYIVLHLKLRYDAKNKDIRLGEEVVQKQADIAVVKATSNLGAHLANLIARTQSDLLEFYEEKNKKEKYKLKTQIRKSQYEISQYTEAIKTAFCKNFKNDSISQNELFGYWVDKEIATVIYEDIYAVLETNHLSNKSADELNDIGNMTFQTCYDVVRKKAANLPQYIIIAWNSKEDAAKALKNIIESLKAKLREVIERSMSSARETAMKTDGEIETLLSSYILKRTALISSYFPDAAEDTKKVFESME